MSAAGDLDVFFHKLYAGREVFKFDDLYENGVIYDLPGLPGMWELVASSGNDQHCWYAFEQVCWWKCSEENVA